MARTRGGSSGVVSRGHGKVSARNGATKATAAPETRTQSSVTQRFAIATDWASVIVSLDEPIPQDHQPGIGIRSRSLA